MVFTTAHANFAIGDEVSISQFYDPTASEIPVFYPSDDATKVYLRLELTNGLAVRSKTSGSNTNVTFVTADFAKMALKAYAARLVAGDGFGSITVFAPSTAALPAQGATAEFTHGYEAIPAMTEVSLVCVDAGGDLDFEQNDVVPINQFFERLADADDDVKGPAFSVKKTASKIIVQRYATAISVTDPATDMVNDIDPAK